MTLIPANGYSLKYIRIKTGAKIRDEIQGGIRITHNEDGTVTVLFSKVTEPLNIQLTGVSPVSNTSTYAALFNTALMTIASADDRAL